MLRKYLLLSLFLLAQGAAHPTYLVTRQRMEEGPQGS